MHLVKDSNMRHLDDDGGYTCVVHARGYEVRSSIRIEDVKARGSNIRNLHEQLYPVQGQPILQDVDHDMHRRRHSRRSRGEEVEI